MAGFALSTEGAAVEVRIFPLLTLGARPSPLVQPIVDEFRAHGFNVSIEHVSYEFQPGCLLWPSSAWAYDCAAATPTFGVSSCGGTGSFEKPWVRNANARSGRSVGSSKFCEHTMNRENRLLQRVRKQCLSFPESHETASWGHPNFRAGKRIFVAFEWIAGRPSIAFRLNPTDVDLLLRRKGFFVTPYGQGRWVSLWADRAANRALVSRLVEQSYRVVALKRMVQTMTQLVYGHGLALQPIAARGAMGRRC